jgi:DNA gyrase subunit A
MDIVSGDKGRLLVISEQGYGKVTKVANFAPHRRGGVGIKAAVVTSKTGPIIEVKSIEEDTYEVLLISNRGQAVRVSLKDIPVLGRTTQGVRIMRMSDEDSVASVGLLSEKPLEEGQTEDQVEEETEE